MSRQGGLPGKYRNRRSVERMENENTSQAPAIMSSESGSGPPPPPPIGSGPPPPPPPPISSLGDLVTAEKRKIKNTKLKKAAPAKPKPKTGPSLADQLAAKKGKLKQSETNVVKEKKQDPMLLEITQGMARLRKVKNRRISMGESKGHSTINKSAKYKAPRATPKDIYKPPAPKIKQMKPKKPRIILKPGEAQCDYCGTRIKEGEVLEANNGTYHSRCFKCNGCQTEIEGEFMLVGSYVYHAECLVCNTCKVSLVKNALSTDPSDGNVYCAEHIPRNKCASCGEVIKSSVISKGDVQFHAKCFNCSQCQKSVVNEAHFTVENTGGLQRHCVDCHKNMYSVICSACGKNIQGKCLKLKGKDGGQLSYHLTCYRCVTCRKPLRGKKSYRHQDEVYCETHFLEAKREGR